MLLSWKVFSPISNAEMMSANRSEWFEFCGGGVDVLSAISRSSGIILNGDTLAIIDLCRVWVKGKGKGGSITFLVST